VVLLVLVVVIVERSAAGRSSIVAVAVKRVRGVRVCMLCLVEEGRVRKRVLEANLRKLETDYHVSRKVGP